jgi:hypothetical protein
MLMLVMRVQRPGLKWGGLPRRRNSLCWNKWNPRVKQNITEQRSASPRTWLWTVVRGTRRTLNSISRTWTVPRWQRMTIPGKGRKGQMVRRPSRGKQRWHQIWCGRWSEWDGGQPTVPGWRRLTIPGKGRKGQMVRRPGGGKQRRRRLWSVRRPELGGRQSDHWEARCYGQWRGHERETKGRTRDPMSHPVLEGKPNANHVRARISYSRTQQLHNMDIITQCSNSIKRGNNSRLHHTSDTST